MTRLVYIKDSGITAPAGAVMIATRVKLSVEYTVSANAAGVLILQQKPRLGLRTTVKVLGGGYATALPDSSVELVGVEGEPLLESALVRELDETDRAKLDKMTSRASLRYRNLVRARRDVSPAALASTDPEVASRTLATAEAKVQAKLIHFQSMVSRISSFIGENITTFGGPETEADEEVSEDEDEDEGGEDETAADESNGDSYGNLGEVLSQVEAAGMLTDSLYHTITRIVRERAVEVLEPLDFLNSDEADDADEEDWGSEEDEEDDGTDEGDVDPGEESDLDDPLPEIVMPPVDPIPTETAAPQPVGEAPVGNGPRILQAVPQSTPPGSAG